MQDVSAISEVQPFNLLPGERVVWRGRPRKRLIFRAIDIFLIPFSLFWAGFVVFWNLSVWTSNAPGSFGIFGLPFLAVGIYFAIGRFMVDAYRLERLNYTVTNQRVVITRQGSGSVQSLDIHRLPNLSMTQKSDGSGTLTFGEEPGFGGMNGLGFWQATSASPPRFLAIEDVAGVFQRIQRQAAGLSS